MAIPLFFIATILFVAAYRGQLSYLATNVEQDVKGFLPWLAAMIAIGVIGIIPKMRPVSNALFFLVFLVLLVANKGIFSNIKSGQAFQPISPPAPQTLAGQTANPPAAGQGVSTIGSNTSYTTQGGSTGGVMSNIIPFPTLAGSQGGISPGIIQSIIGGIGTGGTPGVSSNTTQPPDNSGVTIESIDIQPVNPGT